MTPIDDAFKPLVLALRKTKFCQAILGCEQYYKNFTPNTFDDAYASVTFICKNGFSTKDIHAFLFSISNKFQKQYGGNTVICIGYLEYAPTQNSLSTQREVIKLILTAKYNSPENKKKMLATAISQLAEVVNQGIDNGIYAPRNF